LAKSSAAELFVAIYHSSAMISFCKAVPAVSINLTTTYRALSFSPARIGIVPLM
jgi:hypothetical protein